MKMTALTLHEPWATWVALNLKPIETRTHDRYKSLIGKRIAIHAGKRFDRHACTTAKAALEGYHPDVVADLIAKLIDAAKKPNHGRVVCTTQIYAGAWLAEIHNRQALVDCGPNAAPRFGFFLRNTKTCGDPTVYRGRQGIWTWTPRSAAQIRAAKRIPSERRNAD